MAGPSLPDGSRVRFVAMASVVLLIGGALLVGCGASRHSTGQAGRAGIAAIEVTFDISKATSPQDAFPQEAFEQRLLADPEFRRLFRRVGVTAHTWVERTAVVFSLESSATRADVTDFEQLIRRDEHVSQVIELAKDPCSADDRCV